MPFRIRAWHVAIAVILLCAMVASGLYYLRVRSISSVARLLKRFPEGESSVLYMDLAALRASGVLQRLARTDTPPETEYREFVEQSGFDYAKDLDAVLVSFQGDETFFLLRGHFDWGRLVDFVTARGGDCYNGFCRTQSSTPNRWISFFAVTPSIMAMAVSRDAWAVDSMLTERSDPIVTEVPSHPVWLTLSGPALNRIKSLPPGTKSFASALAKARQVTLALGSSGDAYQAELRVDCRSTHEALDLAKQLQNVTDLLRRMIRLEKKTPNARDLSGVLAGGVFHQQGSQVEGRWPVGREFLEALSESPL
jgi:hypothetical protein